MSEHGFLPWQMSDVALFWCLRQLFRPASPSFPLLLFQLSPVQASLRDARVLAARRPGAEATRLLWEIVK